MLSPTLKSGGTRPPSVPHRSTPVVTNNIWYVEANIRIYKTVQLLMWNSQKLCIRLHIGVGISAVPSSEALQLAKAIN